VGNSFSGIDDLTWVHDRHTFKAGVEFRYIQMNQEYGQHGKITFSSVENLAAQFSEESQPGPARCRVNGCADDIVYAQDEYKLRGRILSEPGLPLHRLPICSTREREGQPLPTSRPAGRRDRGVGSSFGPAELCRCGSRVAFAWTAVGRGRQ